MIDFIYKHNIEIMIKPYYVQNDNIDNSTPSHLSPVSELSSIVIHTQENTRYDEAQVERMTNDMYCMCRLLLLPFFVVMFFCLIDMIVYNEWL